MAATSGNLTANYSVSPKVEEDGRAPTEADG